MVQPLADTEKSADPKIANAHYTNHLADVNKTSDVITTSDIYNEQGMLIVKKGTRISHKTAQTILQHKLFAPLEEQVCLQNTLTDACLFHDIHTLLKKYKDLGQIHERCSFNVDLRGVATGSHLHPTLMQKLTVLTKQFPEEYEKSLFSAWLATLIARELGMQAQEQEAAFLAGLFHDIGLLHIDPEMIRKQGALSSDEWRAIQSHVVVGELMIKNLKKVQPRIAQAILEHHERCDGSGYPIGKAAEKLDVLGQIVGMADSMQAIRVKQFERHGRNLRDAMPYLHMNSHAHFGTVYRAMCSILHKSGLPASLANPHGDVAKLRAHLLAEMSKLKNVDVWLQKVIGHIEAAPKGIENFERMGKVLRPFMHTIYSSGLLQNEIVGWLQGKGGNAGADELKDLLEMELMQNELRWQLQKACKVINTELDKDAQQVPAAVAQELKDLSKRIGDLLQT